MQGEGELEAPEVKGADEARWTTRQATNVHSTYDKHVCTAECVLFLPTAVRLHA